MTGLSAKQSDTSPFQQHYSSALEHLEQGRPEKAAQRFRQAAIADPEKWCDVARELASLGHADVALSALHQVISLHPDSPTVLAASWNEVGNIVYDMGDTDKAREHFEKSWNHYKTFGSSANLALMSLRRGKLSEAEQWINISLGMNPWSQEAQMVQADINFNLGKYRTAFRQYECRWRTRRHGLAKPPSPKPEWPGPQAKEGRLLVVGEQGMGDVILVLRYAHLIRGLGLKQTWVVHEGLRPLAESMGVIDQVLVPGEHFDDYHFQIASASLPRAFGTSLETIPTAPYIPLPRRDLEPIFRVGLCWRGSSKNPNDKIRSTNLWEWLPVLAVPGIEFHSLQFGDGEADLESFPQVKRHPRPQSWLETARIVSGLDLVISVDTATVHLCGAMGVPCWVPLHCRPYFVYPMCRQDCPWYPSVKLFKQSREFEWQPVFKQIATNLNEIRTPTS
jgi:Tfp pilus assembly protein PilF